MKDCKKMIRSDVSKYHRYNENGTISVLVCKKKRNLNNKWKEVGFDFFRNETDQLTKLLYF
jgi:hypothetical protein